MFMRLPGSNWTQIFVWGLKGITHLHQKFNFFSQIGSDTHQEQPLKVWIESAQALLRKRICLFPMKLIMIICVARNVNTHQNNWWRHLLLSTRQPPLICTRILAPPYMAVGVGDKDSKHIFKALRGVVGTSNFQGLFLRGSVTCPYKKIHMFD